MNVVIAGAGIGGLVTALSLVASGHRVRVFEAVQDLHALGVGINLQPNAIAFLDQLGLLEALLEQGIATRELSYFNRHGQLIWTEPRGLYAGYQAPQISISRGQLQMLLLAQARARLGNAQIVSGEKLIAFRSENERAIATFQSIDGGAQDIEADLLICADGIHSAGRRQLYPTEGPPLYSGRLLWRATSYAKPFRSGATMFMAGHEAQKFVCYPIAPARADGLQCINWIAELRRPLTAEREDWNRTGAVGEFLPEFETWKFDWLDIPDLINRAEHIYKYPMVDREPVESWTSGCVTLLGDAAHPMYPIGSNGASQAILDAAAITQALTSRQSIPDALRAYQALRLPATAAIVRANRGNGPDQCMQLAEERAPDGFESLDSVFAAGELEAIANKYKQVTGATTIK